MSVTNTPFSGRSLKITRKSPKPEINKKGLLLPDFWISVSIAGNFGWKHSVFREFAKSGKLAYFWTN